MQYELVRDQDYLSFPVEPEKKWLALEEVCRRSLNEVIAQSQDALADELLRLQYMNIVSAAAEELGISGIDVPVSQANFNHFLMAVTRTSTRLRLKYSSSANALSVSVSRPSRSKILTQIERLRRLIDTSDFPEAKKKDLRKKISDLEAEIVAQRVDFGRVFAALAFLSVALGGTTAFLADAPEALATITSIFGEEKLAEEEEQRQIEAAKKPIAIPDLRGVQDDDSIPF
jgi:hypothetical protein